MYLFKFLAILVLSALLLEDTFAAPRSRKCPKGQYLNSAAACVPCRPGSFKDTNDDSNCQSCPEGTFNMQEGATECFKCPVGTYRRNAPEGELEGITFGTECSPCQAGTFTAMRGTVACEICPLGTFSKKGSNSCQPCPKNQFGGKILGISCKKCPKGTSSLGFRPAACKDPKKGCPYGTFLGKSGDCEGCRPGERLDTTKKKCVKCPPNSVSNGGADTDCRRCPKGKVAAGDDSIAEGFECECVPGTIEIWNSKCRPCRPGFYWKRGAGYSQELRRTKIRENGSCGACQPGFFNDKPGALTCKLCPAGTFSDETGATHCQKCPAGSASVPTLENPADSTTRCIVKASGCPFNEERLGGLCMPRRCPDGYLKLGFRRECRQCRSGEFLKTLKSGKVICHMCPPNSVSRGGMSKCERCGRNQRRDENAPSQCVCSGKGPISFTKGVGLFEGKCQICPAGSATGFARRFGSVQLSNFLFDSEQICYSCQAGLFSSDVGSEGCEYCPFGGKYTTKGRQGTKCIKCPPGTKNPTSVFGHLLSECAPA